MQAFIVRIKSSPFVVLSLSFIYMSNSTVLSAISTATYVPYYYDVNNNNNNNTYRSNIHM